MSASEPETRVAAAADLGAVRHAAARRPGAHGRAVRRRATAPRLPLRRWLPEGKPRAVVLALHGFNDYSNAFADAGPVFAAHGIALYAYDQRGFGAAPAPGRWPGSRRLVDDALAARCSCCASAIPACRSI